jgi:hypothetical protein
VSRLVEDRIAAWLKLWGETDSAPDGRVILAMLRAAEVEIGRLRSAPSPREDAVWAAAYVASGFSNPHSSRAYADNVLARLREACSPQGDDGTVEG